MQTAGKKQRIFAPDQAIGAVQAVLNRQFLQMQQIPPFSRVWRGYTACITRKGTFERLRSVVSDQPAQSAQAVL